mgnify:CR=1 FL=1
MLVSEEKVEGILNYLAESDDDYGKLSARVKGLELSLIHISEPTRPY